MHVHICKSRMKKLWCMCMNMCTRSRDDRIIRATERFISDENIWYIGWISSTELLFFAIVLNCLCDRFCISPSGLCSSWWIVMVPSFPQDGILFQHNWKNFWAIVFVFFCRRMWADWSRFYSEYEQCGQQGSLRWMCKNLDKKSL